MSKFKYESTFDDPTFHQNCKTIYSNRILRFYLSYRFGQMKGEIKKVKRGIKNDDVKSGGSYGFEGNPKN